MKVFLYEVLSLTLMSYETAGQMLGQLQSFLSYSSTHKHLDIWWALSVNNTVRNSQPWYLSHCPILPSLLCPSPLLFKLISSLLTLHTNGISFLYICFAWAVNFFVTFNWISSFKNSVSKCSNSIVSSLSTKIVTQSSLYLTLTH